MQSHSSTPQHRPPSAYTSPSIAFELNMASHPIPTTTTDCTEEPLTADEGWALFWSLDGSMKGWFPEDGGASGALRKEHEDWEK